MVDAARPGTTGRRVMAEQPPCYERGWHRTVTSALTSTGRALTCLDCGDVTLDRTPDVVTTTPQDQSSAPETTGQGSTPPTGDQPRQASAGSQ